MGPRHRAARTCGRTYQRDKPRFTYKKRFARAQHERLHAIEDDGFLHEVSERGGRGMGAGSFRRVDSPGPAADHGVPPPLLPRDLEQVVAGEPPTP